MAKSAFELGKERRKKDQEYIEGTYGEIGKLLADGTFEVFPDATNHTEVWVRINGDNNRLVVAINHKVTPKARLPIRMRQNQSRRWEILDDEPLRNREFMGDAAPTANLPYLVGDALDVMLNSEHFRPGMIHPESGNDLVFRMETLIYGDTELGGIVDATTAVGSIGGGLKALVVFSVDPTTNTITATKGTDVGVPVTLTRAMALAVAIPVGDLFLWAYIFSEGATTPPTSRLAADTDFQFDLRSWITLPGAGGSGTVTSVALSASPSSVFNISGSPVTTTGTLALSMDDQNANKVLAGPATGADAAPAFRALVDDDIPAALTLVGGSINNTPIGATTANTGLFSALSLLISTFKGIFTHANTADRTYTFPNYDGTVATIAGTETFTNKTLTTPTISDFTNMQHDHLDTDDGGTLDAAAIASGAFTQARLVDYFRQPVVTYTTANINIASPGGTIGVVGPSNGDRVLLTGQSTGSQNGIWVYNGSTNPLTRPVDYAAGSTIYAVHQMVVLVMYPASFRLSYLWALDTTGTITIDTTATTWARATFDYASGGTGFNGYTKGDLLVGNSLGGLDQKAAGTDNHALVSDSSSGNGLSYKAVDRLLASQYSTVTVTATNVDTSLLTGSKVGSFTVPANGLVAGSELTFDAWGIASRTSGNTTINFKFGGSTIFTIGPSAIAWGTTANALWHAYVKITCQATGGSGSVWIQGQFTYYTSASSTAPAQTVSWTRSAANTVDTTGTLAVDLSWLWQTGSTGQTVSCTNASLRQAA